MDQFYKCLECKKPYFVRDGYITKCDFCGSKERDSLNIDDYTNELRRALRLSRVFIHFATFNGVIGRNSVELLGLIDGLTSHVPPNTTISRNPSDQVPTASHPNTQ